MLKQINFREFEGNRETTFCIEEKEKEIIIYQKHKFKRTRKIHVDRETFNKLEEIGKKRTFRPDYRFEEYIERLEVYVIPEDNLAGAKLIRQIEGKWALNMNVLIDKTEAEQIIRARKDAQELEEQEEEKQRIGKEIEDSTRGIYQTLSYLPVPDEDKYEFTQRAEPEEEEAKKEEKGNISTPIMVQEYYKVDKKLRKALGIETKKKPRRDDKNEV